MVCVTCYDFQVCVVVLISSADFDMGPRRAITFPMFGDGIFTQQGAAWKHSRELLRPQLRYKQYEDLTIFKQSAEDLLDVLASQVSGAVDLQPLFFRYTLDVTTEFLFGESVKSLKAPGITGESGFAQAFNLAQEYVVKRFRLLDLYWLIGGSEFYQACSDVHKFADQIIDRNLSRSSGKDRVFLDAVATDAKDRDTLRGQIINLLAAGRDTTACLLTWTFFLLVRHPNIMAKLRTEIASLCPDQSQLTRTDLRKMTYLQNILKETLRLYPSVPVNTRTATRTTVLPTGGGPDRTAPVIVPKGTAVAYSVYSMHRRPDLYGLDAEIFRPERWDEDMPMHQNKTNAAWGYLPFNGGPRICIGMDFAMTEAAYTVVLILLRFPNISLPATEKTELVGVEKQTMTLVVSSTEGCVVDIA
jgi:cytochrome P450